MPGRKRRTQHRRRRTKAAYLVCAVVLFVATPILCGFAIREVQRGTEMMAIIFTCLGGIAATGGVSCLLAGRKLAENVSSLLVAAESATTTAAYRTPGSSGPPLKGVWQREPLNPAATDQDAPRWDEAEATLEPKLEPRRTGVSGLAFLVQHWEALPPDVRKMILSVAETSVARGDARGSEPSRPDPERS